MRQRVIVVLSTSAPGGISKVVSDHLAGGLGERWPLCVLSTHDRGSRAKRARIAAAALATFVALILRRRVALVHAHVAMRGSFWRKLLFLRIAKACRAPYVVHLHGSEFEGFSARGGRFTRSNIDWMFSNAARVIALSGAWEHFVRSISPGARVTVVHNAVDVGSLASAAASRRLPRARRFALLLGEVGTRKGVLDLIRAVAELARRGTPVYTVIAGSGQRAAAGRLAADLGVAELVALPGWADGEEKLSLLANACFYVLPSYNEGLPISMLEAMACGLPVIATPVGGIPYVLEDGGNGLSVPPGDPLRLADAMETLLRDAQLRARLGRAGQTRVRASFDLPSAIGAISAVYEEVLRPSADSLVAGGHPGMPEPPAPVRAPSPTRIALVCSSGGHLFQLYSLRAYWGEYERFWVTFRTDDSRHMLKGESVYWAFMPTNRSLQNLLKNLRLAARILSEERPHLLISTGAGVAVPFLLLARVRGVRTIYIESITRCRELSLSGRLVYLLVDKFVVQSPELAASHRKAEYWGRAI